MKKRIHIAITGAVQGVGFRPYIYRLAKSLNLKGYVKNDSAGVIIEAEGPESKLEELIFRIKNELPPLAFINTFNYYILKPVFYDSFEIKLSDEGKEVSAIISPDIAICGDCLREMFNPEDRRFLYPFINCTNCGPRYSIIEKLPYDRKNTTMKIFDMCEKCANEYNNPDDRRFHAQPIACPECGPQVQLMDRMGNFLYKNNEAIKVTVDKLKKGHIIAIKGLGGFHIAVDSGNSGAVNELRKRKRRDEKPFALMFPALDFVNQFCYMSSIEEECLLSPESPILILERKKFPKNKTSLISDSVAPNNLNFGVMLPYTPLHHLILSEFKFPLVATSGNLSEEPICIDEIDAIKRLNNIADFFLIHNRPIIRHVDDSIIRVINNSPVILRRARGYAPLPVRISDNYNFDNNEILGVGGHLKNTVAIKKGNNIFISQHIGDLSTETALNSFEKTIKDLSGIYSIDAKIVVSDLHPGYASTKYADSSGKIIEKIQHHIAHIASCRIENQVQGSALGISWDGTGYGLDNTIWGGEFILSDDDSFNRIGNFRTFNLPGGEAAVKEPRRSAFGILYEMYGDSLYSQRKDYLENVFSGTEIKLLSDIIKKKINSPVTSSVGRLFDAVSSLLGLCHISNYEGQAAIFLENTMDKYETGFYSYNIRESENICVDWAPLVEELLKEKNNGEALEKISAKFHNTLANIILDVSKIIGEDKILLSGGCFQNKILVEKTIKLLRENKFQVFSHCLIPPNDGGISFGQIAAYLIQNQEKYIQEKHINNKQIALNKEIM